MEARVSFLFYLAKTEVIAFIPSFRRWQTGAVGKRDCPEKRHYVGLRDHAEALDLMAPGVTDLLLSRWRGDERAFGLGDLVGVARTCIIENGPEPIAAQGQADHGEWLPGRSRVWVGRTNRPETHAR